MTAKKQQEEEKNQVEVNEPEEVKEEKFDTEGLLPEEEKMAREHGLIKEEEEDGEHAEQPEPETKEDNGEQDKEDESKDEGEAEEKPLTFDEVEQNEELAEKYNPNEKALYWKWKADKKKRQEAQKQADELKAQLELAKVKDKGYSTKVQKISELLSGEPEKITVEAIQSILGEAEPVQDDSKPLTKADLERIEADKAAKEADQKSAAMAQQERIATAEKIGLAKYKNFKEITDLAKEVVSGDKSGTYSSILNSAFADDNIDEDNLVEQVVTIAKLSPKYNKLGEKSPDKQETTEVDRVVQNSKKKMSSASISSGGGKRTVDEDDLTPEDAINLNATQWSKLKPETRERLLKG